MPQNFAEKWTEIEDFPLYSVSNLGKVMNTRTGRILQPNHTVYGDQFVKLYSGDGIGHVRSVRVLVASAYVYKPNWIFDTVIVLDGDRNNLRADNLEWKPRWYALKYAQKVDFDYEFDIGNSGNHTNFDI